MSLILNHNMAAINTARHLDQTYSKLFRSTERISSGYRINNPDDDAAGFAIRELMRSDLVALNQGLRNASDGISLIQTADGAMAVIDEKLTRMKELAEQAATGTYTTVQREIINSEYQAMAAEIDRIASATYFNGVKLLDGSNEYLHDGKGLKIHFGLGDDPAEDYYFLNIGDVRATSMFGLQVGGDAKNDIWYTNAPAKNDVSSACCGGGIAELDGPVSSWKNGQMFSYGYNWDQKVKNPALLKSGKYLAGAYAPQSGASLQDLINMVNKGTQSRVRIDFLANTSTSSLVNSVTDDSHKICLGDEIYFVGSASLARKDAKSASLVYSISAAGINSNKFTTAASAFTQAVNNNSQNFWARLEENTYRPGYTSVYVFSKEGGEKKDLTGCDIMAGNFLHDSNQKNKILWHNDQLDVSDSAGVYFSNGGLSWGNVKAIETGYGSWGVSLTGRDTGNNRDLWVMNVGSGSSYDIRTDVLGGYSGAKWGREIGGKAAENLPGLDRDGFFEQQNASDGNWAGAHIRTQSSAQKSLNALENAIVRKDKIRAQLGAAQNRLENTISDITFMINSLQGSESRISDTDIASEMTIFSKNQVIAQAAVAMLSQANAMPQMVLSLLKS